MKKHTACNKGAPKQAMQRHPIAQHNSMCLLCQIGEVINTRMWLQMTECTNSTKSPTRDAWSMQRQRSSKHKHHHNQEAPFHIRHEMKQEPQVRQLRAAEQHREPVACTNISEPMTCCREERRASTNSKQSPARIAKVILQQRNTLNTTACILCQM